MSTIKKYLKEFENLVPLEETSDEKKLEFVQTQLEAYQLQVYRARLDVKVAQRYIAVGEEINEESYITTGESNIKEAVQSLRSMVIHIQKLIEERDRLKKELTLEK